MRKFDLSLRSSRSSYFATFLDRKSGSAGMPRPISYAVFCLKKNKKYKMTVFSIHILHFSLYIFYYYSSQLHLHSFLHDALPIWIFLMSRKIILIKQELLLLVYELNRSGLLAENEKIRPILAQLEKLLLCDLSPSTNDSVKN